MRVAIGGFLTLLSDCVTAIELQSHRSRPALHSDHLNLDIGATEARASAKHAAEASSQHYMRGFRHECTAENSMDNTGAFFKHGGAAASKCPGNTHLEAYVQQPCAKEHHLNQPGLTTALVIGGNTGTDCVGFSRLLSGDPMITYERWTHDLLEVSTICSSVFNVHPFF